MISVNNDALRSTAVDAIPYNCDSFCPYIYIYVLSIFPAVLTYCAYMLLFVTSSLFLVARLRLFLTVGPSVCPSVCRTLLS